MARLSKPVVDYDDPTFDYKRYWQERQYEHQAEELVLKKFFKLIPEKKSLVDIGGGFGRLVPLYAPIFEKTILVDPSKRLLEAAEKLEKKYQNFEAIKGTASKLPLKEKAYDIVLMVRAIHHLASPDDAFREINRILKPNGYFILEFANKLHFKAILKALFTLNFYYFTDHTPIEKSDEVIFYNLHPTLIVSLLRKNGFKIIKAVSVSNFRATFLKKILPLKILLFLENLAQKIYPAYISGPSVFILAQKT
ncbi:hypothetical protein AMJ51_00410 [Microgenomates bacterium DG_75]|nr:MAG: hypothetical protein AMJ51_00410 [Microgenomates bacterium DG_75]